MLRVPCSDHVFGDVRCVQRRKKLHLLNTHTHCLNTRHTASTHTTLPQHTRTASTHTTLPQHTPHCLNTHHTASHFH